MDPVIGSTVAAAKEVKQATEGLLERLLGPSVDVWGEHFKQWNEGLFNRRAENVNRVLEAADRKLGTNLEDAGSIPPRVLKEILDDGSFVEDELVADYFGGVLASSVTGVDRDDRGASMAKAVADLSSFEIRMHYIFYRQFRISFEDSGLNVGLDLDCKKMELYFPAYPFLAAMDVTTDSYVTGIIGHSLQGLHRRWLIGDGFSLGKPDKVEHSWATDSDFGLIAHPSAFGATLFMWAHGLGNDNANRFTESSTLLESDIEVLPMKGVRVTKDADGHSANI